MADVENKAAANVFLVGENESKAPILADYCAAAMKQGRSECFWICYRQHGRTLAKDMAIDNGGPSSSQRRPFRLRSIARHYGGWWKRFSVFSAVGVKEFEITFRPVTNAPNPKIDVLVSPVDTSAIISQLDQRINDFRALIQDRTSCGMGPDGTIHKSGEACANVLWDGDETYCPVEKTVALETSKEKIQRTPQMLEFYCSVNAETDCLEYLRARGFVYSYRGLRVDSYSDIVSPYGKKVTALYVDEGWHMRYLACLGGLGIAVSLAVTAIVTLVEQDPSAGLAAGSYAMGIVAILLAVFTLLSQIL